MNQDLVRAMRRLRSRWENATLRVPSFSAGLHEVDFGPDSQHLVVELDMTKTIGLLEHCLPHKHSKHSRAPNGL